MARLRDAERRDSRTTIQILRETERRDSRATTCILSCRLTRWDEETAMVVYPSSGYVFMPWAAAPYPNHLKPLQRRDELPQRE
jgi:hypothetical protein